MIDPRSTSPGSIMPSYQWMAEDKVNLEQIQEKLKVMIKLGVPYTKDDVEQAKSLYLNQALEIKANLEKEGVQIHQESELTAMIAYLQRLGKDWAQHKVDHKGEL